MQRIFRIIILTFMFVALPLISWYYLKTGAQWRRDNLNELDNIAQMRPAHYIDGAGHEHNLLERMVCVAYYTEDSIMTQGTEKAMQVFDDIYDQFSARPELRLVVVSPPENRAIKDLLATKRGANTEYWVTTGGVGGWKTILWNAMDTYTQKRKIPKYTNFVCLSDINGNIRGAYNVDDKESVKKLVQHLAILLPLK